nr:cation:proton antiporter [Candidatus Diapherotrites archaeon]
MIETPLLFLDIGFVIIAGTILAHIAKMLKQPLIVGYIIAGIIIGPIGLGLIRDYLTMDALAELGVAFLLFAVGMQIDFSKVWKFKKTILFGGIAQIAITALSVTGIMNAFGMGFVESVYIGLIMAFSSTAVAVKLLSDSHRLDSLEAKLIIGYLLIQDMAAVIVLPLLANPETILSLELMGQFGFGILGLFALVFLFSKIVFPKVLKSASKNPELFYLTTISSCFLFMLFASAVNFSIVVGAFLGGLAISRVSLSTEALSKVVYIRDLFATIFFVSLGMQLNLAIFAGQSVILFPILLLIVFILNPLIFYLVTMYSGFGNKIAWFVGLSLAQASEFSFIIARQGFKLGQIAEPMYNIVIWVILISMITTPYLMRLSGSISSFSEKWESKKPSSRRKMFFERTLQKYVNLPSPDKLKGHIIIAGGGVFGGTIAEELKESADLVVVDHDPEVLQKMADRGIKAVYGSKTNEEVWNRISLANAKAIVVTIPEAEMAIKLVRKAKAVNSGLVIFGRAHYFKDALQMYRENADVVVMPAVLGSNACLEEIKKYLQTGKAPEPALREEFIDVLKERAKEE